MKNQFLLKASLASLVTISALSYNNQSKAAGFASDLYSTSGLATSYAGSSAGAHDISDSFSNPAIIGDVNSNKFIVGGTFLNLGIDADETSAGNGTITGSNEDNGGVDGFLPSIYYAAPITDKLKYGLSVTTPYALSTKYDKNWIGRYHAIDSEIVTANINPILAYQVNEQLSIGGGFQAQYMKATLTRALNLGTDGYAKTKGDDWGYGFNLGLQYKPTEKVKLGVGYRSKIEHKLDGKIDVTSAPGLGNPISGFTAGINTPETVSLGATYQLSDNTELLAGVNWARWSRLKELAVNAETSTLSETMRFNWDDSWKYSIGLNYKANAKWILKAGTAYEQGTMESEYRSPIVPTGDVIWLSAGATYKVNDDVSIDTSYLHQHYRTTSSNIAANTAPAVNIPSLQSQYKVKVDTISAALRLNF